MSSDLKKTETTVHRLEYIGSKFKLVDWILEEVDQENDHTFADLFSGSGIVSLSLRTRVKKIQKLVNNDKETYSFFISKAMGKCVYTEKLKYLIGKINDLISKKKEHLNKENHFPLIITKNYSPYGKDERMFFKEENALAIDFVRFWIEDMNSKSEIDYENDYTFLIASLIVSADKVSNTASVYGAYLKSFKQRALENFTFYPIHTFTNNDDSDFYEGCTSFQSDIVSPSYSEKFPFEEIKDFDFVYLDPPYNSRQYSKNYFPLNVIIEGITTTKSKTSLILPDYNDVKEKEIILKGKTGIPQDCFISSFCTKKKANESFCSLFKDLITINVKKILLSYNSESILSSDEIIKIVESECEKQNKKVVINIKRKDYQRFKSSSISQKKGVIEYLFVFKF